MASNDMLKLWIESEIWLLYSRRKSSCVFILIFFTALPNDNVGKFVHNLTRHYFDLRLLNTVKDFRRIWKKSFYSRTCEPDDLLCLAYFVTLTFRIFDNLFVDPATLARLLNRFIALLKHFYLQVHPGQPRVPDRWLKGSAEGFISDWDWESFHKIMTLSLNGEKKYSFLPFPLCTVFKSVIKYQQKNKNSFADIHVPLYNFAMRIYFGSSPFTPLVDYSCIFCGHEFHLFIHDRLRHIWHWVTSCPAHFPIPALMRSI